MKSKLDEIISLLKPIVAKYRRELRRKTEELLRITPSKRSKIENLILDCLGVREDVIELNPQYYHRRFGDFLEEVIKTLLKTSFPDKFRKGVRVNNKEICDMVFADYAIEIKFRYYSGNAKTVREYASGGEILKNMKYRPVMLIFSTRNLESAIQRFKQSGWLVYEGDESVNFLKTITGFDLVKFLEKCKEFQIT